MTKQAPLIEKNAMSFDIQPFHGALPVAFGMSRDEVHRLLGLPESSFPIFNGSGTSDHFTTFNVGYNKAGIVTHVGFSPGKFELTIHGQRIWDRNEHPDPNPIFLKLDPEPLETLGFLVFLKIGVTTTGYHDDDPSQQAISVFPKGKWDNLLTDAKPADVSRYKAKK